MIITTPTWMYHPSPRLGARLFRPGDEIPDGWYDTPGAVAAAQTIGHRVNAEREARPPFYVRSKFSE